MEIKCPTCGYVAKDSIICPRCRTQLISCFNCSGNCSKCSLSKKDKK
ncbi:MAG: hypothetical protein N2486_08315 [Caloramator sp.]|nr:hypothetical protein [Caloramator sp.]